MDELKNIIRDARKSKRLQSKQVAEMIGVSASQFCRIEKGNNRPSIKTLKEICKVLNLDFRKMTKIAGYSENTINKSINCSKGYIEKIDWYLSQLSNQDLELVADFIMKLPNLTNKERDIIKLIISYKNNASD